MFEFVLVAEAKKCLPDTELRRPHVCQVDVVYDKRAGYKVQQIFPRELGLAKEATHATARPQVEWFPAILLLVITVGIPGKAGSIAFLFVERWEIDMELTAETIVVTININVPSTAAFSSSFGLTLCAESKFVLIRWGDDVNDPETTINSQVLGILRYQHVLSILMQEGPCNHANVLKRCNAMVRSRPTGQSLPPSRKSTSERAEGP